MFLFGFTFTHALRVQTAVLPYCGVWDIYCETYTAVMHAVLWKTVAFAC